MTLQELKKLATQIQMQEQEIQQIQQNQTIQQIQQKKIGEYSRLCQNRPFWIWNSQYHETEYKRLDGNCCFNHIIPAKEPVKYIVNVTSSTTINNRYYRH